MRKIIKIVTAIGNENLNNKIREEKDFVYKEGILEYLEINKNIDIIILYEKLPGEINFINLIKKIKLINNEICIYCILESKNEELEKLLKLENIKSFFYINEINIGELILELKNSQIENSKKLSEEIILLKKIINQKNEELLNIKNNRFLKNKLNKKIFTVIQDRKVFINKSNINKIFLENKINLKNIQIEINNKNYFINKKIAKIVFKKLLFN